MERGTPYINPRQREILYNDKLRRLKTTEQGKRQRLLNETVDPTASKERKAALVFRFMEENKRADAQMERKKELKEFTGFPDLSKTLQNKKKYSYFHPGKWVKISGKDMWSCCSSGIKDSRGSQWRTSSERLIRS